MIYFFQKKNFGVKFGPTHPHPPDPPLGPLASMYLGWGRTPGGRSEKIGAKKSRPKKVVKKSRQKNRSKKSSKKSAKKSVKKKSVKKSVKKTVKKFVKKMQKKKNRQKKNGQKICQKNGQKSQQKKSPLGNFLVRHEVVAQKIPDKKKCRSKKMWPSCCWERFHPGLCVSIRRFTTN